VFVVCGDDGGNKREKKHGFSCLKLLLFTIPLIQMMVKYHICSNTLRSLFIVPEKLPSYTSAPFFVNKVPQLEMFCNNYLNRLHQMGKSESLN